LQIGSVILSELITSVVGDDDDDDDDNKGKCGSE
jgi:hypothetical protein